MKDLPEKDRLPQRTAGCLQPRTACVKRTFRQVFARLPLDDQGRVGAESGLFDDVLSRALQHLPDRANPD